MEGDGVVGGRKYGLTGQVSIFTDAIGIPCQGSRAGTVQVKPIFDYNFDFDVSVDIGATVVPPFAELNSAHFIMDGSVKVGLEITGSEEISAACSLDLIDYLRDKTGRSFKYELPDVKFFIGPVPITITHAVEPVFSLEAKAAWSTGEVKTTDVATYGLRVGSEYKDGKWRGIWKPTRTATATLEEPEGDQISLSAGASVGVEYKAFLWDTAGPKASIKGGVTGTFTYTPDTCEWETSVDVGASAALGAELQIPAFDVTLADYETSFDLASTTIHSNKGSFESLCADAGVEAGPEAGTDGATDGAGDGPAWDIGPVVDAGAKSDIFYYDPTLTAVKLSPHFKENPGCYRWQLQIVKKQNKCAMRPNAIVYNADTGQKVGNLLDIAKGNVCFGTCYPGGGGYLSTFIYYYGTKQSWCNNGAPRRIVVRVENPTTGAPMTQFTAKVGLGCAIPDAGVTDGALPVDAGSPDAATPDAAALDAAADAAAPDATVDAGAGPEAGGGGSPADAGVGDAEAGPVEAGSEGGGVL